MKGEYISASVTQTKKIAGDLAKNLKPNRKALVIGLTGELGSGKTTFIQGFARTLGVKDRIVSPTFVLMRRHKNLIHIDAYRIDKPKEILGLEWREMTNNPQNIILVEWVEKIKEILPKKYIQVDFKHIDKNKRWIKIKKY